MSNQKERHLEYQMRQRCTYLVKVGLIFVYLAFLQSENQPNLFRFCSHSGKKTPYVPWAWNSITGDTIMYTTAMKGINVYILGLKCESSTVDHWADVAQVGSCISVCELCYPNCTYTPGCGGALRLLTSADLSQAWPLRTTSDHRVWNATLHNAQQSTYTIIPCELNSQRLSYLVKRSRENYLLSWYSVKKHRRCWPS